MDSPGQAGAMDMGAMVADIVPEIILVLGGITILFYALFAPRSLQAGAALLALATVALATGASVVMLGGPDHLTFAGTYARDGVAIWGKLIVLAATAGVIALSVPWFRRDPRHGEYYTLLLFSALGAILLAGATDLQQFVLALVLSSATGFVLVAYHRASSPASEAAIKYYLLGAFTSASVLIGVAVLFGIAGSTSLTALADLPSRTGVRESVALVIALTLVLGAVAFKLGAVPVHAWMPDVAQGAPAPVAAFVTTIPKVGGFIFLARLLMALPPDALHWRIVVAVLATATMTLGNLAALWQDDVRRLLGWSSVSQTGYGLMAVVALGLSDLAVPSLLYFLLAYAVGNIAAFGVVVQLRGRTRLADYDGLARTRPWLAGALVVSFLSFIGIPPLAGFFAKLVLFGAAIEAGYGWLAVVAAVNTVISIVYYVRVLAPMYFGPHGSPVGVLSRWAGGATLTLAAAVLVIGLVSEPFIRAFGETRMLPDDGTRVPERVEHTNLGDAPPRNYLVP
jgi:NADH-quinone oxidoreductase subunit N